MAKFPALWEWDWGLETCAVDGTLDAVLSLDTLFSRRSIRPMFLVHFLHWMIEMETCGPSMLVHGFVLMLLSTILRCSHRSLHARLTTMSTFRCLESKMGSRLIMLELTSPARSTSRTSPYISFRSQATLTEERYPSSRTAFGQRDVELCRSLL